MFPNYLNLLVEHDADLRLERVDARLYRLHLPNGLTLSLGWDRQHLCENQYKQSPPLTSPDCEVYGWLPDGRDFRDVVGFVTPDALDSLLGTFRLLPNLTA